MKVAFVLNSLGIGGSERKVVRISNKLVEKGIEVHILYLGGEENLKSHISSKVHVVNVKNMSTGLIGGNRIIKCYLQDHGILDVLTVNMYPLLYVIKTRFAFGKDLNWVSLINTTYFETFKKELQMLVYRPVLSVTSSIVFGAEAQKRIWQRKYLLPSSSKLKVLYNGVDTDRFSSSKELTELSNDVEENLNLPNFESVFISVAQLRIEKGHEVILEAAAIAQKQNHNFAFLFVGKGPIQYEQELKHLVDKLGLTKNVFFVGQVDDPRPYILASDAFLLASESETFSNAALEAMSLGIPAILSDVGGASEMVETGKNGFLFKPNNPEHLYDALNNFVNIGKQEMLESVQNRIQREFTFEKMVRNYIGLIEEKIKYDK